jgi:cyanophycin synthetase
MGIITIPGDRRTEDFLAIGRCAAEMLDDIIIRHDHDNRGRANDEITGLIKTGIHSVKPDASVRVISDEVEAIQYAIHHAPENAFILVCADDVQRVINFVTEAWKQDSEQHEENKLTTEIEAFQYET